MKNILFAFLLVFLASAQIFAQQKSSSTEKPINDGLIVRGQVVGLEVEKTKDNRVLFYVRLNVEFTNEGTEPIILFKPQSNDRYWLGGWLLYATEADARDWKDIFRDDIWESISGHPAYRELAAKLDVKTPPADYTKILQPRETWTFTDEFGIRFEAETHIRSPEHRTWKEMQEFSPQLWLRIKYEISPWHIEYFKPDLIRQLKKRWAKFGRVLVEKEREGPPNQFVITSEPMSIDFSQARVKEPVEKEAGSEKE